MRALLILLAAALIGLDAYLTYRRMKKFGFRVELNPVTRTVTEENGLLAGMAFHFAYNIGLLWASVHYGFLQLLVGLKLGLAAMQLKSFELELIVERLLSKRKQS